jgi:predicted transcriptional regulator
MSNFSLKGYGNYWYDWTSPDNNSDGIIDQPYVIDNATKIVDSFPSVKPPVPISGQYQQPKKHYPKIDYINIQKNKDFLIPGNGVISGVGTESDPFIISGWDVSTGFYVNVTDTRLSQKVGIHIENTTAHFVIRDLMVDIPRDMNQTVGIYLRNIENAIIENCSVTSTSGIDVAISISDSKDIMLKYNSFTDGYVLLKCLNVQNLSITNNWFTRAGSYVNTSLEASDCDLLELKNNNISGTNVGFIVQSCNDGNITGNTFDCSYYRIILEDTVGLSIYRNAFLGIQHDYYVTDNNVKDNRWDGGYPIGGNYWETYSSEDKYSGSNQDRLGSDDVWDKPFLVCPGCYDRFPITSMKKTLGYSSITAMQTSTFIIDPIFASIPSAVLIVCLTFVIPPEFTMSLLGAFLVPLFMRLKNDRILDNFFRGRIYGYISDKPGCTLSEMRKDLSMLNGNLSYHLAVLQRAGLIKSTKVERDRIFSISGKPIPIIARLNVGKTGSLIIDAIQKWDSGPTESQIAAFLGMSRQRVHYQLNKLEKRGVVLNSDGRWKSVSFDEIE